MHHDEDALAAMREVNRIFDEEVCGKKNFDALARVYTQDASILPPGGDIISGLEGIRAFWKSAAESLRITHCRLQPFEVEVHGDCAHEVARGEVGTESGAVPIKYIVIWKKDGGHWKWHRDIWNMNG
ncbi:YybH family protein [Falsiroseomonas sp. E2-1-a20]|uniref:YybH family protein n=1 Tax=Falsiroseomonas sp. E2-1-a20 TaxID=3239300 RepID=UPI003F2EFA66